MTKCTSKASYNETKESGQESTQSEKILDIISIGGSWSMQEVMAAYRAEWGSIELSSVSARINKLKADSKVIEGKTRKCSISGKIINSLSIERQRTMGEFNAYVERGKSKEERNLRLNAVPSHMKAQVRNHVETVFKLKAKNND